MPENARLPCNIQGSFTLRKSTTWDRRHYFPSEGRRAEEFFALKNPSASVGFELANLGTKGQHATFRPPKPPRGILYSALCFKKVRQARLSIRIHDSNAENVWTVGILRRMIQKCCHMRAFTRVTKWRVKPKIHGIVLWIHGDLGFEFFGFLDARSQNCEKRILALSCVSVCLSACPHRITRLPLDGFSWNLMFEYISKLRR